MSLEGDNLRKNRLELMGLPGFGNNSGSPRDIRPRRDEERPPINDFGMDLEGAEFQSKYGSGLGVSSKHVSHENPSSKTRRERSTVSSPRVRLQSVV